MHGHVARKRFGQNFLADPHYTARIVAAVDPQPGENVVEIGPGLAAITGGLIERAGHVTAIEIDRDLGGAPARAVRAGTAHIARGRCARIRFRVAAGGPAHRGQPAVQHQLAAALPSRVVRRTPARPACHAAAGGRGADDGRAGHRRLRQADGHAAGEIRDPPSVRRAAGRVSPGAQGRIGHCASGAARCGQAANHRPAVVCARRRRCLRATPQDAAQCAFRAVRRGGAKAHGARPRLSRRDAAGR